MTIDEVKHIVDFIYQANGKDGYVRPVDFNMVINQAAIMFVNDLIDPLPAGVGMPKSNVSLGHADKIREALKPLLEKTDLTKSGNFFILPDDYLRYDTIYEKESLKLIPYREQDKMSFILTSSLLKNKRFFILSSTNSIEVYPSDINEITLRYFKKVPEMRWAYTIVDGYMVFDPVNSIDPLFDELSIVEIISRACLLIGINIKSSQVVEYSQLIKNQGS